MRKSWFVSAVLLILVMLLTSVASAQSAPRVIPANDNFANAKPIVIGKSYTVPDIGAATVEAGQPTLTSCAAATAIHHSVWFSVYLPSSSQIYLSTEGTTLMGPLYDTYDTVIAVFLGPGLGSLTQVGCNDDAGSLFSELTVPITGGMTYYVLAGTYSATPFDPTSVLKLNTRMKQTFFYFNNYDFEQPLMPADWKVSNSTGDAQICSNPAYPPINGACAFRFVGNAGEASKLKQALAAPTFFVPRKNGLVIVYLHFRVMDAPLGPVKVTTKATYLDGTPCTKRTSSLTGQIPMASYGMMSQNVYLASGKLATISLEVSFKSTTGALLIDYAYLNYAATASTRDAVLPAPVAAVK